MATYLLAIDQGTTSTRAILFDAQARSVAMAQEALPQIYPALGWVEHDPEEIWRATLSTCRRALSRAGVAAAEVVAIGITNQRETTILWDRKTGQPLHNAIVWQDRRTADRCRDLASAANEALVRERSGLVIDPYFSATKIGWLLDRHDLRARAERGEIAFGTVDSFLLWRLTGGQVHATDATNAARTSLMNIHTGDWDEDLLALFQVPRGILPEIRDTAADFGATLPDLLGGGIAIGALAGDQQAALVGQACFAPGETKSTYGTGCFIVANTGTQAVVSDNRLLTTVAYRLQGKTSYALEGSIFIAGAAIQWLRDGLGILADSQESAALAASLPDNGGVYFVPALTGLGAPYWDPEARGLISGLSRQTTAAHLVRAALEAVSFQTSDLLQAMQRDGVPEMAALRVDGGMVGNDWLLQNMADLAGLPVERAAVAETTALGAAFLAGLQTGVLASLAEIARLRRTDGIFRPAIDEAARLSLFEGWREAVDRCLTR